MNQRGYIGILMLLLGTCGLVLMYLYYSPLRSTGHNGAPTRTEAAADIEAAKDVQKLFDSQNKQYQDEMAR